MEREAVIDRKSPWIPAILMLLLTAFAATTTVAAQQPPPVTQLYYIDEQAQAFTDPECSDDPLPTIRLGKKGKVELMFENCPNSNVTSVQVCNTSLRIRCRARRVFTSNGMSVTYLGCRAAKTFKWRLCGLSNQKDQPPDLDTEDNETELSNENPTPAGPGGGKKPPEQKSQN